MMLKLIFVVYFVLKCSKCGNPRPFILSLHQSYLIKNNQNNNFIQDGFDSDVSQNVYMSLKNKSNDFGGCKKSLQYKL